MNNNEVLRQLVHLSGVLFVVVPHGVPYETLGAWLIVLAVAGFVHSEYANVRHVHKLPRPLSALEHMLSTVVKKYERANVRFFKGATMFALGAGIALIAFAPGTATLAVIGLAVGDSVSTLVGVHFGKHKLPFARMKSWEGTLSAFVAVYGVAYFYTTPQTAALVAVLTATVEAFETRIDDNVLIPLAVGTVLTLL